MNGTGNNVDFCFVKLALDESGRIDAGYTITLIWRPVISDYFFSSLGSFANTQSGVFVFFLELLIISMRLLLRLRIRCVKVTERVVLVFFFALFLFELLFIILWQLCW